MKLPECKGCAERRKAIADAAKRIREWMRNPVGPPPLDPAQRPRRELPISGVNKPWPGSDSAPGG